MFGWLCHILTDPPKSPLSKGDFETLNTPLYKGGRGDLQIQ